MVYGPSVVLATSGCCCDRLLDFYMYSNNIIIAVLTESVMDGDHVYACIIHKWHWGQCISVCLFPFPFQLYLKLGWRHAAKYVEDWIPRHHPHDYILF